ncbi:hypothetical protein PIB30_048121 [Stylosanthes scabra]|uniref:Arp2/3 complex 34 kDa subunit n=1 Tax=Stylosanthes scabra TaxID=79078 RepID=A0ABU6QGB6_9FABA|nr:hypothetical protein [Stylosanthes scabra]
MACIERASPALNQILLKLYSAEKPVEIDHHLYEFGSFKYHILCQACEPQVAYLSISTPPLCPGILTSNKLSSYTIELIKRLCPGVVEIAEATREGYQLTLRLNLTKIPRRNDYVKVIKEISTVHSVILSSQLKEILWNFNSDDAIKGMHKPIKLAYNPREPFFVIRQPPRIIAVFPIRFAEKSDVIISTAFFQELVDVGSLDKYTKAPPCSWSAIPPPELRGEAFEDLSTNGGFVSFDISAHHVDGKRLDKTVWNLLNFNAYVRFHVKTTKGFIQRRMRKRLENLVEVLHHTESEQDNEQITRHHGCSCTKGLLVKSSKYNILKQRWGNLGRKLKRIHFRVKIQGFGRFRQRWLRLPKFSSSRGYTKLG